MLPIHIITVVHNGMPFIAQQIEVFKMLPFRWRWSISEGITPIPKDFNKPGNIASYMHNNGLSVDGTHEYLKLLSEVSNVFVTYDPDIYLTDRCNAMLKRFNEPCIAWQIDCDEFWMINQIYEVVKLFEEYPEKTAARFYSKVYVGPDKFLRIETDKAGNMPWDWWRVFRWQPGCEYVKHDPPTVVLNGKHLSESAFSRDDTRALGLVFNHYAFTFRSRMEWKAERYGWPGALDGWDRLQVCQEFPQPIEKFIPHLGNGVVEREV